MLPLHASRGELLIPPAIYMYTIMPVHATSNREEQPVLLPLMVVVLRRATPPVVAFAILTNS